MKSPPSAEHRRMVLDLADELGNVAEACRRTGTTRTQFYQYRRRWEASGMEGLRSRPPIAASSPHAKSATMQERIGQVALLHPDSSVERLCTILSDEGFAVSARTVRKYLDVQRLRSKRQRWLALERLHAAGQTLDGRQAKFVENWNPCFRSRDLPARSFGERIHQACLSARVGPGKTIMFVHCAVDAHSLYAFADLQPSKGPESAVALLHEEVLPHCDAGEVSISAILTNQSRIFSGKASHLFSVFLQLFGIRHIKLKQEQTWQMAPVVRFLDQIKLHFIPLMSDASHGRSHAEMRSAFRRWVRQYNCGALEGFPTYGKSPLEMIAPDVTGHADPDVQQEVLPD